MADPTPGDTSSVLTTTMAQLGSDYTYSIIGFVVVLALLLSAITAIFIACICCGHCKSYPLPAQGQRPSTLHSTPHSRTGLGSITSPRQLPTSRSFRYNNQFPLPNSTTDTSISAHQSSPHTPASVIHLGQLPPLDHALRHGRRRPSLPPLSTTPSHLPHGSRSHFRHYHQLSEGLHNDNPELVGGGTGGGAAGGCRTPMSAGVLQSATKFPSPLLLQDKQHKHRTGLSNNLDHTHLTPNDVNKSVRLCPHPSDVIQLENAIRPLPEGVVNEGMVKSKAARPLPEGVTNGPSARPLPEGVVVSCSPREGNLNGLVPSVQASSTTCV